MSLDGAHHANESTLFDESVFADYVGTPWLTGLISFATVIGTFVAALMVILILGRHHNGALWPDVAILVADVAVNIGLRLERRRRRRAHRITE